MNDFDLNSADPPSLSPALTTLYSTLSPDNKQIFVKVFKFLWSVVIPARRFTDSGGMLYSFWLVDLLRHRSGLSSSELSLLTYLYQVTEKGNKTIHSNIIYNGMLLPDNIRVSKQRLLNGFKRKGYIIRLTRDPSVPYLRRSISQQPVFIKLTSSGVRLIEGIEKELRKILINSSLDDLTGANKKP
jgi:hypothetical protein